MDIDSYEQLKALARRIYLGIGSVYCPLLDDHIHFTAQGFNHLMRKGRKFRSQEDRVNRFNLIQHLKAIVSDPKADIHYDSSKGISFWTLVKEIDGHDIRVVIVGSGSRMIFLSVYPPHPKDKKSHR
jgi:hypothetical protein